MTLDKRQIGQIQSILTDPRWELVKVVAEEYIKMVQEDSALRGNTEYEFMKIAMWKEYGPLAIRNFLSELENVARPVEKGKEE